MSRWREFKAWLLQESSNLSEVLRKEASESDAKDFKIRQEKLEVRFYRVTRFRNSALQKISGTSIKTFWKGSLQYLNTQPKPLQDPPVKECWSTCQSGLALLKSIILVL